MQNILNSRLNIYPRTMNGGRSVFQLTFSTRVLGESAAERLRERKVTQTLRSSHDSIVSAMLSSELKVNEIIEIALDEEVISTAYPYYIDRMSGDKLTEEDAHRGGFSSLALLREALLRAGYRFKPFEKYAFYRIQFTWKEL